MESTEANCRPKRRRCAQHRRTPGAMHWRPCGRSQRRSAQDHRSRSRRFGYHIIIPKPKIGPNQKGTTLEPLGRQITNTLSPNKSSFYKSPKLCLLFSAYAYCKAQCVVHNTNYQMCVFPPGFCFEKGHEKDIISQQELLLQRP